MVDNLDTLWHAVEQHPNDADAKRRLARAIALEPGNADTFEAGERVLNLIEGLKWAAARGRHPYNVNARFQLAGMDGYSWLNFSSGGSPKNDHARLPGPLCTALSYEGMRTQSLPDAFAALGKALREIREMVEVR